MSVLGAHMQGGSTHQGAHSEQKECSRACAQQWVWCVHPSIHACWGRHIHPPPSPTVLLLLLHHKTQTVKYLYLSFVDAGSLLDYYVLSTEGHLLPSSANPLDAHMEEDDYVEVGVWGGGLKKGGVGGKGG